MTELGLNLELIQLTLILLAAWIVISGWLTQHTQRPKTKLERARELLEQVLKELDER